MFHIWRAIKIEDLQKNRYRSESRTAFTFPDTLGAVFFGISLLVFYFTTKRLARSRLSGTQKVLSFIVLEILVIFGILAHVFDTNEVYLNVSSWASYPDHTRYVSISAGDSHRQFVPKLHSFFVMFTGWVAAHVLAIRAYILAGRVRWLGFIFAFLLFSMIVAQIVLISISYSAFPSHPIVNLVIQIPVTFAVLFHAYKHGAEYKKSALDVLEGILLDCGAALTVVLILQTVFPFVGVGGEALNSVMPHIQNITTCTVFIRLIEGVGVGGAIRLGDDEPAPGPAPRSPA